LKWDEVVEYAFLADFDLLWDVWAMPAARHATDLDFKMYHAKEEIQRVNNESDAL
jgi:hypothetical protein